MIRTIIATLAFVLFTISASAQDNGQRQNRRRKMDTTEMYNRQAERLVKQMKLDDEKKDLFTVLYLDYMAARQNAANPKGEEEKEERVDMSKMTDEQATEMVQKQFAKTEAQLKVDKDYYPKFLEILTPVQAAQVFVQRGMGGRNGGDMPRGNFGGGRGGFGGNGGFGGDGGFGGPGGGF